MTIIEIIAVTSDVAIILFCLIFVWMFIKHEVLDK
jgi:hypothetical protein